METVNINLINLNSNYPMILAKLTSSKHTTMMVPYKLDMGCSGNIRPFNIFKKLFPYTTEDSLVAAKDTTMLRTYNSTTTIQLGKCGVVIENNNKYKKIIFFVVPGDGDVLLGILILSYKIFYRLNETQ